jgi:hypothetical protein
MLRVPDCCASPRLSRTSPTGGFNWRSYLSTCARSKFHAASRGSADERRPSQRIRFGDRWRNACAVHAILHELLVGDGELAVVFAAMTRAEYERAAAFMAKIGVRCPPPDELARGRIIGSVLVVGIVARHRSRWFRGPHALVLNDPRPAPSRSALGQMGLFTP